MNRFKRRTKVALTWAILAVSISCGTWYAERVQWARDDAVPDRKQVCETNADCVIGDRCPHPPEICVNRSAPEAQRRTEICNYNEVPICRPLRNDDECLCVSGLCVNAGPGDGC